MQQVLCKAYQIGRHTLPILRPNPPQTVLWKGTTLRDPKDPTRNSPIQRGLKPSPINPKRVTDELGALQPSVLSKFSNDFQIGGTEADRSRLDLSQNTSSPSCPSLPQLNLVADVYQSGCQEISPKENQLELRFLGVEDAPSVTSSPEVTKSHSSPLDWLFGPKDKSFSDRVMARLIQAEAHEINVHLREDYRQAFMTVTLAAKGNTMPFVVASYQMYGVHPDKVWPKIVARHNAILGRPIPISLPRKPEADSARPHSASVLPFKKKEGIA